MESPATILSSASNPSIQFARQVRDGKYKEQLWIEGDRLLGEAIAAGVSWHQAFCPSHCSPRQLELLLALRQAGCPIHSVTEKLLQSLSATVHSQGLIGIANKPNLSADDFLEVVHQSTSSPQLVVLDNVQDPGNVGTILRTAEAAGCHGVITFQGCADPFSNKALRSSMGSAFRLPILHGITSALGMALLHQHHFQTLAAATQNALPYRDHDYTGASALILGNEGNGISPAVLAQCMSRLTIPIHRSVESLNVATAAAVILFEAAHQRSARVPLSGGE